MRKFLAALLSVAILFSISVLVVGCGEDDVRIQGDFKEEATQEEVDAAVKFLSENGRTINSLGVPDENNWINYETGMKVNAHIDATISYELSKTELTLGMPYKMSINGKVSGEGSEHHAYCVYSGSIGSVGSADVSTSGKITTFSKSEANKDEQSGLDFSATLKGDTYLHNLDAYLDGSFEVKMTSEGEYAEEMDSIDIKKNGKMRLNTNSAGIGGIDISDILLQLRSNFPLKNIGNNVEAMIKTETEGITTYIDDTEKELKIKISLDAEAVLNALGQMVQEYVDIAQIEQALELNSMDYYFRFDKETKTSDGAELKLDLSLKQSETIKVSVQGVGLNVSDIDLGAELHMWVFASDQAPKLPTDFNDYKDVEIIPAA